MREQIRALVREQVARAGQAEAPRARRHASTASTSPTGRSTRRSYCPWDAEAGHYYYTTESYRDDKGRTQTRQVQHVRWEPASGSVDHFFDDEPVPGTQGVSLAAAASRSSRFRPASSCPTTRRSCPGFVVEHYQVVLVDAAKASEDSMRDKLEQLCAAQVPGDTYRNLVIHPTFSARTFKHILVPLWLLTYTYGAQVFQVLVNGYTGRMAGEYPKSFWKVFFLVVGIIILVLIVLLAQGNKRLRVSEEITA